MRTKLPLFASTLLLGGSLAAYAASGGTNIVPQPNMSDAYVTQQLRDLGFSNVTKVEHVGGLYEVLASRGSTPVELRVDAQTGRVTDQAGGDAGLEPGGAIVARPAMTASYVREHLVSLGYDNVHHVRRIGGTWVALASQDGVPVTLHVANVTASINSSCNTARAIPATANMNSQYVKRQLLAMGYDQVSNVKQVGGQFQVTAWQDGQPFELRVDSVTGRITNLSG